MSTDDEMLSIDNMQKMKLMKNEEKKLIWSSSKIGSPSYIFNKSY